MDDARDDGLAVVAGASGAIGAALVRALRAGGRFGEVAGLSRGGAPGLDVTDEASVAAAAGWIAGRGRALRLVIDATGMLHDGAAGPEKSWRQIDPVQMARAFAVNAIGPALLMKHMLPLLPREGRAVFASLSARVGSIGDNALGGWYSYRASKAALNQLVRTAAIELRRTRPEAICVALHPGTVASGLSAPFAKAGLDVQTPEEAAARLLAVVDGLGAAESGGFFDHRGAAVPW